MIIMEPRRSEGRKKNVMQPVSGCGWLAAALR